MLKTHFQLTRDTVVGIGLFTGVFLLFFINAFFVVISLIDAYGVKKVPQSASAIDDSVLSQAVKALNLETSGGKN